MPYLQKTTTEAAPQCISGRTSYLRVRLEFLLYPQLIQKLCTVKWFGPPRAFRLASPCPWVAHSVSGLIPATIRPVQTRFRYGFGCHSLNLATEINSQAHSPRGTLSGIVRNVCISTGLNSLLALQLFVGFRFQVLFHSPNRGTFHLSLTVLVHYRSSRVFSLGRWASRFPTGLACPMVLKDSNESPDRFRLRGFHPLCRYIPERFG